MIIKNKFCSDEKRFTPHVIVERDGFQTITCSTCKNPVERSYKMIRQSGNTINIPSAIWDDYKKNGGDVVWDPFDAVEERENGYEDQQRELWRMQRKEQLRLGLRENRKTLLMLSAVVMIMVMVMLMLRFVFRVI